MSQQAFKKFINQKSNASVKEQFRHEKKTAKKEKAEAINKKFEEQRANRQQSTGNRQLATGNRQQAIGNRQAGIEHRTFSQMPLNKFLAHCGVTSRRDAIPLIKEGKVTVNGKIITEPGF